ncbi:MAG: ribosomal protein S18-alanine N-acetyltransferase [Eubacteriales bacterium]|nr:ribosomal protein S18-alanine N-acetyltransferase [Eubacteriales bacterium]
MAEVTIRRMALADAKAVHAVEAACFPTPWPEDAFVQEMRANPVARYLVALEAGRVIGFAGAHIILDEGHITNVAVLKQSRGRGVGRALVEALMQYAANLGAGYLTLEVRESNTAAISLYASLGFIKVSVRKRYYEDNGEDALLMVCGKLPPADPDFTEAETANQ